MFGPQADQMFDKIFGNYVRENCLDHLCFDCLHNHGFNLSKHHYSDTVLLQDTIFTPFSQLQSQSSSNGSQRTTPTESNEEEDVTERLVSSASITTPTAHKDRKNLAFLDEEANCDDDDDCQDDYNDSKYVSELDDDNSEYELIEDKRNKYLWKYHMNAYKPDDEKKFKDSMKPQGYFSHNIGDHCLVYTENKEIDDGAQTFVHALRLLDPNALKGKFDKLKSFKMFEFKGKGQNKELVCAKDQYDTERYPDTLEKSWQKFAEYPNHSSLKVSLKSSSSKTDNNVTAEPSETKVSLPSGYFDRMYSKLVYTTSRFDEAKKPNGETIPAQECESWGVLDKESNQEVVYNIKTERKWLRQVHQQVEIREFQLYPQFIHRCHEVLLLLIHTLISSVSNEKSLTEISFLVQRYACPYLPTGKNSGICNISFFLLNGFRRTKLVDRTFACELKLIKGSTGEWKVHDTEEGQLQTPLPPQAVNLKRATSIVSPFQTSLLSTFSNATNRLCELTDEEIVLNFDGKGISKDEMDQLIKSFGDIVQLSAAEMNFCFMWLSSKAMYNNSQFRVLNQDLYDHLCTVNKDKSKNVSSYLSQIGYLEMDNFEHHLLIPICYDNHYSLVFVLQANNINKTIYCLHMDSLSKHKVKDWFPILKRYLL